MSKKSGGLGPSNDDIPEDEMLLAKLIQNAGSLGLKSTTGAWYRNANGAVSFETFRLGVDVACCASGAMELAKDTDVALVGIIDGNDGCRPSEYVYQDDEYNSAYTVGQCFYDARKVD